MKKTILTFILLLIQNTAIQAGEWEIVSTMPIPVKGAQAVVHDTTIYILGGFSDSLLTGTKIIQAYYPNSNSWEVLEDSLIMSRDGLSAHVYNDKAYIYGGAVIANDSSYALETWDFSGKPEIHNFDYNFNRKFSTSVIAGDYLYVFGGYPDFRLFDSLYYCIQFNIQNGEVIDSFAINDFYSFEFPWLQMSATIDNKIYVFGGTGFSGILNEVNTFGLENNQWKSEPVSLIEKRAGGVALTLEAYNQIAIIGGFTESSAAMNSIEIFNHKLGNIEPGFSLNIERAECTAALFNNVIYVFGGQNLAGEIVSSIEKINLPLEPVTSLEESENPNLITDFSSVHNYPNPFNPSTEISFKVNKTSQININIFDITGKFVKSLINKPFSAGHHSLKWDGKNDSQKAVSSGIYFYKISSQNQSETKRMILVR